MDPRTGASVRRFEPVEIGAAAVIVLASVLGSFWWCGWAFSSQDVHCPPPFAGEC